MLLRFAASLISLLLLLLLTLSQVQCDDNNIAHTYFEIDSQLRDIKWGNVDGTIVFVLSNMRMYRSADEGMSWEDQLRYMDDSTMGNPYGVKEIIPMGTDKEKGKFFFMGRQTTHWTTSDHGKTYKALKNQPHFLSVKFHPKVEDWMLGLRWSKQECADSSYLNDDCHKDLYVSKDFAATWDLVTTYVADYGWGNAGLVSSVPNERIYFVAKTKKEGPQKAGWSTDFSFYYTDSFSDKKNVVEAVKYGQAMTMMKDYLFVATTSESSGYSLYSSKSGAKFVQSHLPLGLPESGYNVLDTDLGAVFLSANHGIGSSRWGNIYVSDASGEQYSLSLEYNSRTTEGYVDFEKMQGLEGIYVANVLSDSSNENSFLQSRITFNNGGSWKPINAPTRDSNGNVIQCDDIEHCHLQLHGMTSSYTTGSNQFTTFYSVASAVGLMMATGNVGSYLSTSFGSTNTYMSRDAGLTWFEVKKGPYIYEFGDHGALLIMASLQGSSDSIIYSWNQGNTWETLKITDMLFDIDNVITEPSAKSQKFIVYGTTTTGQGILVHLDFTGLHEQQCQGYDNPGSSDSDYEWWSPSHGLDDGGSAGSHCLLGHEIKYIRRKRDHQCYNDKTFEAAQFVNNCTCVVDDFECDSGYAVDPKADTFTCVLVDPTSVVKAPPKPCPDGTSYYIPNGYRLVAGDTCKGGSVDDQYRPKSKKCQSSTSSILLYSFLALLFAGIGVVCVVLYRTNPTFASGFSSAFSSVNVFKKKSSSSSSSAGDSARYYQLNANRPDTVADDEEFALGNEDDFDDGPEELHPDKIKIPSSTNSTNK